MTLDFQEVPGGYGWLFPKGDHINVGLYVWRRDRARLAREHLADYARRTLGSDALEEVGGYPWVPGWRGARRAAGGCCSLATPPAAPSRCWGGHLRRPGQWSTCRRGPAGWSAGDYPLLMADWGEELRQVERISRIFYGVPALGYAA